MHVLSRWKVSCSLLVASEVKGMEDTITCVCWRRGRVNSICGFYQSEREAWLWSSCHTVIKGALVYLYGKVLFWSDYKIRLWHFRLPIAPLFCPPGLRVSARFASHVSLSPKLKKEFMGTWQWIGGFQCLQLAPTKINGAPKNDIW